VIRILHGSANLLGCERPNSVEKPPSYEHLCVLVHFLRFRGKVHLLETVFELKLKRHRSKVNILYVFVA